MLSLIALLFVHNVNGQNANAPFTDAQIAQMRGYFEANIGVSKCSTGFVVAAPSGGSSDPSGDPDYFYHWQRDAAVSMHTLQYTASKDADFDERFQNYVKWVQSAQTRSDPNGINVLGEPKFNCDGSVYSKGWCRPQNEFCTYSYYLINHTFQHTNAQSGPASRAIAQITYANYLLDKGEKEYVLANLYGKSGNNGNKTCSVQNSEKIDCGYVGVTQQQCLAKGCCWDEIDNNPNNYPWCYAKGGSSGSKGTIPIDLNYVISVWNNGQSCDLWEEVRGTNFYTAMVQRYALYYGAQLAQRLNDSATAQSWQSAAKSIDSTIENFDKGGTIQDAQRQWDCSMIVATLYGGTPDKFMPTAATMYPPTDKTVLNTMSQLKSYWDSTYDVNKEDDSNNIPGTLIGRYAEDHYGGCNSGGGSKGHAWILCTNALADVYYRNALYLYENRANAKQLLSPSHLEIYANLFEKDLPKGAKLLNEYALQWKDSLEGGYDIDYVQIMETVAAMAGTQGDAQLQRVAYHVGKSCNSDYHLSEQICELSSSNGGGMEVGAHDLTWSYGTVLSAWYYRGVSLEAGLQFYPAEKGGIDDMVLAVARYGLGQSCGEKLCNGQCSD